MPYASLREFIDRLEASGKLAQSHITGLALS